ncbi:MAG: hypothetical protein ACRD0G_13465 [Acidimicrobiales bacterium]
MAFGIRRVGVAALVATTLFAFTAAPAGAQDPPGVGITTGNSSLLAITLGDPADPLLDLRILQEVGEAVTDRNGEPAMATETVTPLVLSGSLVESVLGEPLSLGANSVTTTGGEQTESGAQLDLASLTDGLLGGSILPLDLRAFVEGLLAEGSALGALTDLDVVGVLGLGTLGLDNVGASGVDGSAASRSLELLDLSLLNLGDLLDVLNLPLDTVLELLNLTGLVGEGSALGTLLGDAATQLSDLLAGVTAPTCNLLQPVLNLLGQQGCVVESVVTDLTETLTTLLQDPLGSLLNLSLLELDALNLSAIANAGRTAATSVADVETFVSELEVLGNAFSGLDVSSLVGVVQDLLTSLSGLLGNIIDINLFAENTNVTEQDGIVQALAAVTGLSIDVNLGNLLDGLLGGEDALGNLLPGLPGLLGNNVQHARTKSAAQVPGLSDLTRISIDVMSVSETSQFRVPETTTQPATPTQPREPLSRTGLPTTWLLFGSALLVVGALGIRRVALTSDS